MDRCEICGRSPAKRVSFSGHQGFLFFRRVQTLSGVLCRDHAIEAYIHARGATLKGMWFSPGSLVFGTLQSLWDSAKLLDLPDEVRDEPWMSHVVACPHCHQKIFCRVGIGDCPHCATSILVASCRCGTVHAFPTPVRVGVFQFVCRSCVRTTRGYDGVRNCPPFLVARAVAEGAARVAKLGCGGDSAERAVLVQRLRDRFGLIPDEELYILEYFDRCIHDDTDHILDAFAGPAARDVLPLLLDPVFAVATAIGPLSPEGNREIRGIVRRLGLDPDEVLGQYHAQSPDAGEEPWWKVLGVSEDASWEDVTAAHRTLARQCHPDLFAQASRTDQADSATRMKRVNAAFDRAKRAIERRSPRVSERREAPRPASESPRPDTETGDASAHPKQPRPTSEPRVATKPQTARKKGNLTTALLVGGLLSCILCMVAQLGNRTPSHGLPVVNSNISRGGKLMDPTPSQPPVPHKPSTPTTSTPGGKPKDSTSSQPPVPQPKDTSSSTRITLSKTHRDLIEARPNPVDGAEVAFWTKTIESSPHNPEAFLNRGIHQVRQGAFEQGITDLTQAISLNPQNARAYHNRGVAWVLKGNTAKAIADFQAAIRIKPELKEAVESLEYVRHIVTASSTNRPNAVPRVTPSAPVSTDVPVENALKYYQKRNEIRAKRASQQ